MSADPDESPQSNKAIINLESYARGYKDGYRDGLLKRGQQNYTEGNKMLTSDELGGDLNLIYAYNRRRREAEANFNETMKRLDVEFKGKVGKVAGDELHKLIEAKVRAHPDMDYADAFNEVQLENPNLTQEYVQELYHQ